MKRDIDVLKMDRVRRRVGVVSAPEVAPRENTARTPEERQENANETPGEA